MLVDYSVEKTLRIQKKFKYTEFCNKNHKNIKIADPFINEKCDE
jgi:hypothetical protein